MRVDIGDEQVERADARSAESQQMGETRLMDGLCEVATTAKSDDASARRLRRKRIGGGTSAETGRSGISVDGAPRPL